MLDLNLLAYDALLSPEYLQRLDLPHSYDESDSRFEYRWMLNFRGWAVNHIDEAKSIMRSSSEFFEHRRYRYAENVINLALSLVSLKFWPQRISLASIYLSHSDAEFTQMLDDDLSFGHLISEDIMSSYLEDVVNEDYDVVGFSVHTTPQLIYALRIIRHYFNRGIRKPHVTIGGSLFTAFERFPQRFLNFFRWGVDSIAYSFGEETLIELCERLREGKDYRSTSGIIHCSGKKVIKNSHKYRRHGRSISSLDYEGLNLDCYFAPQLVANIPASSGCTWGRCNFCNNRERFSKLKPHDIHGIMSDVARRYSTDSFVLAQSALIYEDAVKLAEYGSSRTLKWASLARIDDKIERMMVDDLFRAGCRKLSFGLESYSKALRKKMNKGELTKDVEGLLKALYDKGIAIELFIVQGYPEETRDDVIRTTSLLERMIGFVDIFSVNKFQLSYVARDFVRLGKDDRFLVAGPSEGIFSFLDDPIEWRYRDESGNRGAHELTDLFWERIHNTMDRSETHVWEGNSAFRVNLPRVPEHHLLYAVKDKAGKYSKGESSSCKGDIRTIDINGQSVEIDFSIMEVYSVS